MFSLVLLIAAVAAIYYFFFFKRGKKGGVGNTSTSHAAYDAMQESYNAKKHPKDENLSLTIEEKIELSWEFLTRIAEQVLKKFSRGDQNIVYDAGQKMNKHGMTYQHDVNQEVKISSSLSKSKSVKKEKGAQQAR